MDAEQIAQFWNTPQAVEANRRDKILKALEIRALSAYVKDGTRVLDVGCGEGETLCELAHRAAIQAFGVDLSRIMFEQAKSCEASGYRRIGSIITIGRADVTDLQVCPCVVDNAPFDVIYTERCLINLVTWKAQAIAIQDCITLLKPGGVFLMCEHSQDGLDETNSLRATLGLPAIVPPAHNRYLRDAEIAADFCVKECLGACHPAGYLESVLDFAGTYYWLSRIVHASLAADASQEPQYDAPINKLALELPMGPGPNGFRGYSRLWCFKRCA